MKNLLTDLFNSLKEDFSEMVKASEKMKSRESTLLRGMIVGTEETLGAKFVKIEKGCIFFTVPKETQKDILIRCRDAYQKSFGYTLKVKYV